MYSQSPISGEVEKNNWVNILFSRFDILLGFVLGLLSTSFIDYRRRKRKTQEFREGMRSELKKVLAVLSSLVTNPDSNITRDKAISWLTLIKEFDLLKELAPLVVGSPEYKKFSKKDLSEADFDNFTARHNERKIAREKNDSVQFMKNINCNFIQNNISSISLLDKTEKSLIFAILRRLDAINEQISYLYFFFEKSYDATIRDENHKRLRTNYLNSCQLISDWSYETTKEIAHLLRQ